MKVATVFRLALTALATVGVACTDLDIIPADAQLVCTSDDDCPDGFACRLAIGRCLDSARAQAAPIAVVTAAELAQQRRSQQPGFSVINATASFSTTPVTVGALLDDAVPLDCTIDGDHVVRCDLDLAGVADLVAGEHDVSVFADDGLGTIATSRARFTLDLLAPDVVSDSVVVTYLPGDDNALETTAAIGPTSGAAVQFTLTEVLGSTPTAAIDDVEFAFDPSLPTGLVASLVLDSAALVGVQDGDVDLTIGLQDDVGNARTVTLAALLRVDQTPPAAAAVDVSDAVVYARVPDGNRATAGVPRFALVATRGVEPNAIVVVTTTDAFNSTILGEARADADGTVELELAPVDLASVFVHVVDAAGNVSAAARVRDIAWTASLGGRVPGDPRSNPHALFASTDFDGVSLTPYVRDEVAAAADLVVGGAVDVVARGAFVQNPVLGADTPFTSSTSVVWHAARGEILAVGGRNAANTAFVSTVLRLQGERWVEVAVEGTVPPAAGGVVVYDPVRERLVLVQSDGQTWFFEDGRWRQFQGALPTAGSGAAVAWDERRRGVVRFGGRVLAGTERHNETWFFDGEAWQQLTFPTAPPARDGAAMAFDRVDGCLVLRGGQASQLLSDLWQLDDAGWREVDVGTAPYASGVAVTDPVSGRVQFVGGTAGGQSLLASLTTFDGLQLTSSTAMPGEILPGAAWDLAEQRLIVLGGANFNLGNNQLQRFLVVQDGVARTPLEAPASPGAADGASVAYDRNAGRTVLFGGRQRLGANTLVLTTTRRWDGETTQTLVGDINAPLPFGGLFFDGATVGGMGTNAVLALTGNTWVQAGTPPSGAPLLAIAFTYHAGDDVAFGFGGESATADATDTTLTVRDGVITTLSPATRPPARSAAHVAYDARLDRVVLYGGFGPNLLQDTWVYEGDTWRELDTSIDDVGVAQLVYDETRGVVVRLGEGSGIDAILVDELRDDRWQRRDVFVPGAPRSQFNAAWDVARGEVFLQGGVSADRSTNDVFTWDGDVDTTPAVLMAVDLRARETRTTSVRDIEIVATAGGTGADLDSAAIDGVDVLVWGDAWEQVGGGTTGADGADDVVVLLDEPALLSRIVKERFVLALRTAPSGGGPAAALHVEALEVTVRYREE
jgi:hypothetical protein